MDETKKYVEMCRKAKEIQELRKDYPRNVNSFYDIYYLKGQYFRITDVVKDVYLSDGEVVWLPIQDQLQYMFCEKPVEIDLEIFSSRPYFPHCDNKKTPLYYFETMQQIWLALVMKEKYKKVWDGKEWESIYDGNISVVEKGEQK